MPFVLYKTSCHSYFTNRHAICTLQTVIWLYVPSCFCTLQTAKSFVLYKPPFVLFKYPFQFCESSLVLYKLTCYSYFISRHLHTPNIHSYSVNHQSYPENRHSYLTISIRTLHAPTCAQAPSHLYKHPLIHYKRHSCTTPFVPLRTHYLFSIINIDAVISYDNYGSEENRSFDIFY